MIRLASGLVLAAAALAAILFLPPTGLRFVAAAVAALASIEYIRIARPGLGVAEGLFPVALAVLTCWVMLAPGVEQLLGLAAAALAWVVAVVLVKGTPATDAAAPLVAALYVGLPLGLLVAIHSLGGRESVLLLIGTIVVSDSMQYYTGRLLGRRPLAPAISPKKTIEGAVGGVVFGTAAMMLLGRMALPFARPHALALMGIVIVVLGIAGDLFESRLKRQAGVKDSSALIPGHGGVLDRIDALLLATPAFYAFLHGLM